MEGNLLTQLNIQNPLPSFIEVEVVSNLSRSLHKTFQFAHILLAEKVDAAASLLPYNDEIYCVAIGLLERMLLFHADTTFTEFMFGLRRSQLTGPTAALPPRPPLSAANFYSVRRWLRLAVLGPAPMTSPEERAMRYANDPPQPAVVTMENGNAAAAVVRVPYDPSITMALGSNTNNNNNGSNNSIPMSSIAGDDIPIGGSNILDNMSAQEKWSADRSSYGHLNFKPLSRNKKMISLLMLTLKPYLEKKITDWYAQQTDDATDAVAMREAYASRYPSRARVIQFFVKYIYPMYHITTESFSFLFKLCYLLELTPYTSIMHRLCGIVLRRATAEDALTTNNPRAQKALLLARMLLLVIFFGFNILEFSRNGGGSTTGGLGDESLPLPPAPVLGVDVPLPEDGAATQQQQQQHNGAPLCPVPAPGVCPLCSKRVTNAAVCSASGIVGCYPCLQAHVREHRNCPVTGKAMTVDLIRRVFEC